VRTPDGGSNREDEVTLLTVDEAAELLRTTRKAIYAMVKRGRLPGAVRLGRRVLLSRARLLEFIKENSVAFPGEDPE